MNSGIGFTPQDLGQTQEAMSGNFRNRSLKSGRLCALRSAGPVGREVNRLF